MTAMMNVFSSWLPTKPGPGAEAEDILTPLANGRDQSLMVPVDRSVTPRAPQQLRNDQLAAPGAAAQREHAREASETTLIERRARNPSAANSLGLQRLTDDAMEAHRLHHEPESNSGPASAPAESRRSSSVAAGAPSAFSSCLGGVDSEAALSDAQHCRSDTQASSSRICSTPRRKRKIAPPELLVIVRPPPSKQVNPLNLQIQLVMPNQRREASSRRRSVDSTRSQEASPIRQPVALRRSGSSVSAKSRSSDVSVAPSTAGSTASSSSGRRVTPLYNLGYHSIMSSVVTDAGTDQKVAKYTKKGVDLDGFGILEPTELVTGVNDLATLYRSGLSGSVAALGEAGAVGSIGSDEANSVLSAPPQEHSATSPRPTYLEPPTSFQAMTPAAKGQEQNIGGKLLGKFKRLSIGIKPASSGGSSAPSSASIAAGQPSPSSVLDKLASKVGGDGVSVAGSSGGSGGSGDVAQLTPGAGIAGGKKTEGYYWTVRKWNRRSHHAPRAGAANPDLLPDGSNAVLNSVWKRFNLNNRMGGNERHPAARDIPIRVEWSRESKKAHKRRATEEAHARIRVSVSLNASRSSFEAHPEAGVSPNGSGFVNVNGTTNGTANGSAGVSRVSGSCSSINGSEGGLHPSRANGRPSLPRRDSTVSGVVSPRMSVDHSAASSSGLGENDTHLDSGEESDPEDSETPWSCHLVLGPATRIPIGTLSPAPHHPKLVGQLAVPFPLPDLSTTGLGHDGAGLTREELKDIIMVTCLHLIVRENFGGLVKRKSRPTTGSTSGF
ncbi:hypothetical protein ACQY0O_001397 [Thecaphora frezii]